MKISIITPCYNSEKTIERTICSVVNQKISGELEYLIIDGDSNDGTLDMIRSYSEKYPFIRYVSEKDSSMTEALNKGMRMATGDIIASINADDFYISGALGKILDYFKARPDADIVMANNFFTDSELKVKSKNFPRRFTPLRCAFMECPFPECSVFFRRRAIETLGFFNEKYKYTQDFELYLRQYYAGYKFVYANIDVSCFVFSDTNYSTIADEKMKAEVLSYFKYKRIFGIFNQSLASKILKILFGVRRYYIFKTERFD